MKPFFLTVNSKVHQSSALVAPEHPVPLAALLSLIHDVHKKSSFGERYPSSWISVKHGERLHFAMERSTMLLMGKSTMSMAMFNSFLYVHQRVKHPEALQMDVVWKNWANVGCRAWGASWKTSIQDGFFSPGWGIWVNFITTSPCSPEPWKSWFIWGESSPNGRTIQVSELL